MDFVSIRVITADVARLVDFYERATGVAANWSTEDFAELRTASATLAIASTRTVPMFAPGAARAADNHSVIIEFLVDDVDRVHRDLAGAGSGSGAGAGAGSDSGSGSAAGSGAGSGSALVEDFVQAPTTMPWGNRSLLVRDPDGTLVNFFTPVTPEAIAKFAR